MLDRAIELIRKAGSYYTDIAVQISDFFSFLLNIARACWRPVYFSNFLTQLVEIAYRSLLIISLTAIFTGAVLALQTYNGFLRFGVTDSVPAVVILSIARELGPVLTGLMLSGRTASAIAAELSSMVIGNQISSMRLLAVDPFKFLILPRVVAGMIAMPFLTIIFNIIGFFGSYVVCVFLFDFNPVSYIDTGMSTVTWGDFGLGIIKAFVFGCIITIVGCYHGYNANNGSQGVGKATTNAVVFSSMAILISNYILTAILF